MFISFAAYSSLPPLTDCIQTRFNSLEVCHLTCPSSSCFLWWHFIDWTGTGRVGVHRGIVAIWSPEIWHCNQWIEQLYSLSIRILQKKYFLHIIQFTAALTPTVHYFLYMISTWNWCKYNCCSFWVCMPTPLWHVCVGLNSVGEV